MTTEQKKYYLGLDISSSIVGFCLLSQEKEQPFALEKIGHVKLTKSSLENLFDKAEFAINEIIAAIPNNIALSSIFVEANAKMFMQGKTTADVIITLAKMNVLVSYLAHKHFNAPIKDIHVVSARSMIGYKDNRSDKRPVKEKAREFVMASFPTVPVRTRIVTAGKNKGQTTIETGVADEVDAFIICLGGLKIQNAETSSNTGKVAVHSASSSKQRNR